MGFIYGLISTRDDYIRYIGQQGDDTTWKRFQAHLEGVNSSPKIARWIQVERWLGYSIWSIKIQEEVADKATLNKQERHWTARFPNLLNTYGVRNPPLPLASNDKAHIEALLASERPNFVDNNEGLVGVRFYPRCEDREWEEWSYSVIDCFGVSWSTEWSISDRNEALERRARQRKQATEYYLDRLGIEVPWPLDGLSVRGQVGRGL